MKTVYNAQGNVSKWEGRHWTVKRQAPESAGSTIKYVLSQALLLGAALIAGYALIQYLF